MFQYPQADRRGCNSLSSIEKSPNHFCFSIHKRIEGGATPIVVLEVVHLEEFQYPQADRRGCNSGGGRQPPPMVIVSVSTSGSKGVQHRCVVCRFFARLFQYPQADRRGCNHHHHCRRVYRRHVSVSTSGSKGVQLAGDNNHTPPV